MGIEGINRNQEAVKKEYISQEDFERQFKEEHNIEVKGEIIPYTIVVPEEPTSENWVVYVGGFSQGPNSYLDEIQNLAQAGRKVLFVNPLKGIEADEDEMQEDILKDLPKPILSKARAVQEVLNEVGAKEVDFVGHSQGAAIVTTFAAMHPGIANKIVIEGPEGLLGGNDSKFRMIARFVADKVNALARNPKKTLGKEAVRAGKSFSTEIKKDPIYRYNKELPAVTEVDIAPLLKKIKKEQEDTEVILVNANQDKVFPSDRIEQTLGNNPLDEYVDRWAMYQDKNASHMAAVIERPGLLRQILE